MGPDAMNLFFWMLSFKPTFSLSSFTFNKRLFSSLLSSIRVVSSAYLRLLIFLPAILMPPCASSSKSSRKTSVSALLTMPKAFDCVDHNKLWKFHKETGIPDYLTCLFRNLYAGQEATVRTRHGTTNSFQTGKGVRQGCILSPCLFTYMQRTSWETLNWMKQSLRWKANYFKWISYNSRLCFRAIDHQWGNLNKIVMYIWPKFNSHVTLKIVHGESLKGARLEQNNVRKQFH